MDGSFGGKEIADRLSFITKNSSIIYFDKSGHLQWIFNPDIHAQDINESLESPLYNFIDTMRTDKY